MHIALSYQVVAICYSSNRKLIPWANEGPALGLLQLCSFSWVKSRCPHFQTRHQVPRTLEFLTQEMLTQGLNTSSLSLSFFPPPQQSFYLYYV